MYFYNKIKEFAKEKKYEIYVDMDGVIASYDFGRPLDFETKRPVMTNINTLLEISKIENIKLHILSVCRKDFQIEEKNNWLDKYAPFFKKEDRVILSKETYINKKSEELKAEYLKSIKEGKNVILVDDDNRVLKEVNRVNPEVICFQDSELVD